MEKIETDVLVVGGGAAGCWAALRAAECGARVVLVDKGVVARSGSAVLCHDILAPMPPREADVWLEEVIDHTEHFGNRRLAEIVLRENSARIRQLADWGVPFERDEQGGLSLHIGRGHKVSKVVLCDCRRLMEVLKRRLLAKEVRLIERVMITDLLTSDGEHPTQGRVVGAVGLGTRSGEIISLKARAVVLTTGLFSPKLHFAYADNLTGDAQAMAFRAGAELANLEFNFRLAFSAFKQGRPVPSNLMPFQTLGAYLINSRGDRFMENYAPGKGERGASFPLLALGAAKEILEGRGPVYFDMRHFGPEKEKMVRRILPLRVAPLDQAGIELARDLIEARPVVQFLGGQNVVINEDGETTVPFLLAGGIAACFPGWAEGLSGGALALCNAIGYRAGERAAKLAQDCPAPKIITDQLKELGREIMLPLHGKSNLGPRNIYHELNAKLVRPEHCLVKNEPSIREMLTVIETVSEEALPQVAAPDIHQLVMVNEARNFVLLMGLVFKTALERKESRFCHYRREFPFRDDVEWLKWIVIKKEGGGIKMSYQPVLMEENRIQPRPGSRVPFAVQFQG